MSSSIENPPAVQPRPTTSFLDNGFEFTLAGGNWCGECGQDMRANDAALYGRGEPRMKVLCRECGTEFCSYGPKL
jgi:hypothetical protein